MAKAQTFGDKLKKKAADTKVNVKVIRAVKSPRGTIKIVARFQKLDELAQIEKL